jgi:hypothetical protein
MKQFLEKLKPFFTKWGVFLSITLDPMILALIILVVFLSELSVRQTEPRDPVVSTALTFMLSMISSVAGAIWYDKWNTLTNGKVLTARGKMAVRGLKLLIRHLNALQQRARKYLDRYNSDKFRNQLAEEVIRTYLEEIIHNSIVLQEECLSSIENWTDIVPEEDIYTKIGTISDLNQLVEAKEIEISSLKEVQVQSDDQKKQLKERIAQREFELNVLRQGMVQISEGLTSATSPLGASPSSLPPSYARLTVASLITATTALGTSDIYAPQKCRACGADLTISPLIGDSTVCPRCGILVESISAKVIDAVDPALNATPKNTK